MVKQLEQHPVHLGLGATAISEPKFTGMEWYADYAARHAADGAEGRLVSMYTFSTPWDAWEMHPNGGEVVICTAGEMTLLQEIDGRVVHTRLTTGEYAINPPGVWHTADIEGSACGVHHRRHGHAAPRALVHRILSFRRGQGETGRSPEQSRADRASGTNARILHHPARAVHACRARIRRAGVDDARSGMERRTLFRRGAELQRDGQVALLGLVQRERNDARAAGARRRYPPPRAQLDRTARAVHTGAIEVAIAPRAGRRAERDPAAAGQREVRGPARGAIATSIAPV